MKELFMVFNTKEDLYIQLYNKIKDDITEGRIKKNEKMPSRRKLADALGISVSTVNNAYDSLVLEGYLYTMPKKGYFVSDFSIPSYKKKKIEIKKETKDLFLYDFTTSYSDESLFPRDTINKITKDIIYHDDSFLVRAPFCGLESLQIAIQKLLYEEKGIEVDLSQIIIRDSTSTMIEEIKSLLNPTEIFIENPGYFTERENYTKIDLDSFGMKIPYKKKNSLIITTPFSEYPLGIKMSLERKKEFVDYLKDNNAYLIEDSLDSNFRNQAYKTMPLFLMSDRVIFTESFSRSMFSGLCISYMVLPLSLVDLYKKKYGMKKSNVSSLNQLILKEFIMKNSYQSHVNKLRLSLVKKKKKVLELLDKDVFKVVSIEPYCSIIVEVSDKYLDGMDERFKNNHIKINRIDNNLILGFSSISYDNIDKYLSFLTKVVKDMVE